MATQISLAIRAHFDTPFAMHPECMYHVLTSYFMQLFIFGFSTIIRHMSGNVLITHHLMLKVPSNGITWITLGFYSAGKSMVP